MTLLHRPESIHTSDNRPVCTLNWHRQATVGELAYIPRSLRHWSIRALRNAPWSITAFQSPNAYPHMSTLDEFSEFSRVLPIDYSYDPHKLCTTKLVASKFRAVTSIAQRVNERNKGKGSLERFFVCLKDLENYLKRCVQTNHLKELERIFLYD